MEKRARFYFWISVAVLLCTNSVLAIDANEIEEVMRKYQNKYHYVAVVNNFNSKYLVWPQLHCSDAPSYPIDFYGEVTEGEAADLVDDIVDKFYGAGVTNISAYFLKKLPEGEEEYELVVVSRPPLGGSWQNRLAQVDSDIDKLIYYNAGLADKVNKIEKEGIGLDGPEGSKTEGTWVNGSFSDAKSEAESDWNDSTDGCWTVGVVTCSTQDHSYITLEDYYEDEYIAYTRSTNAQLQADLSRHTGSAYCYLKLKPNNNCFIHGSYSAVDGVACYNPVEVETDPNENPKYYSWGSPLTGEVWTSEYLFDTNVPEIPAPSRLEYGPDEEGNYDKVNEKAWSLDQTLMVVVPDFNNETDPIISCREPNELIYKNKDKHIVYSAAVGCGYSSGETVKGRIIVNDYDPNLNMELEVKLNKAFSEKTARLVIKNTEIDSDDVDTTYCFWPEQDVSTNSYYVPFSISAYVKEDQVSFSIATVYTRELGEEATDPNEAQRIKAYRGEGEDVVFQIKTNGYECCNRSSTLNQGDDIPRISKHENDDIEIFFPDIGQAYIWGDGYFGNPPYSYYSKNCDFLEMSIDEHTPIGDYIKLSGAEGNALIYSIGSDWLMENTAAAASFDREIDADGNDVKTASYDLNGRLDTVGNAADPSKFYRQFYYEDLANPSRITSYTEYMGQVSKTYTLVYDEATGRLAGTVGGTGFGCGSCSLFGENRLYTFNDSGSVLTESDVEGNIIYEYEYDSRNRLIAKWSGPKTDLKPIQEIVYDTNHANNFGGSEIQDVYDYVTDTDYRFTRNILDSYGQIVTEITYDTLNIDSSTISSDINSIIASGGYVTTHEYEYSGETLLSISTKSPGFNEGTIYTYYKNTLNNPSNSYEETIVVRVDPNGIDPDRETKISQNRYLYFTLNGVSVRRLAYSYDARGIEDNEYTSYSYSSNGPLSRRYEPGISQLNGNYTELNYNYTYYADGQINTETISNNNQNDTRLITTYFYNYLGHSIGTETSDYYDNLLYYTRSRPNGFGEQIYSIDKHGVARGKEYDAYGKVISEFVFADANDTALFDGDEPNALTEDISGVYSNLDVVSQKRYIYDSLGRLSEIWIAVADDVFTYDSPDSWYITSYGYDDYSRKNQQIEDVNGLALITTYEYDNQGQLVKTNYPDGRWQKQIRNGRGLVIKTINGYGPESTEPNDFIINETVYDADGHVIKELKAGEVVTSYELDDRGMVFRQYQGDYEANYCDYTEYDRDIAGDVNDQKTVSVDDVGGETIISQVKTRYNVRGERIEHRVIANPGTENDLLDRIKLYSYDFQGKLAETVTKAEGNNQIYTNSNKDRVEYEADDLIEQNWYDLTGNIEYSFKFEYAGDAAAYYDLPFDDVDDALRYTKDSFDVYVTRHNYENGRLSSKQILSGFDEDDPYFDNWNYPKAGLIWHSEVRYEYDNTGRIRKAIDADDNFTVFSYNSRDQKTEHTLWQGKPILRLNDGSYDSNTFDPYPLTKLLFGYDNASRKIRQAQLYDANSSVDIDNVDLSQDRVTDIIYDSYGRTYRERNYFDGENQRIALKEYSYDGLGRIDQIEMGELEEVYLFDELFDEVKTPLKYLSYTYDKKGQKTVHTVTDVNTVDYTIVDVNSYYDYDLQGRLIQIENAQGVTFSCKYDALGRRTEEIDSVGKITQYFYNHLGDLNDIVEDQTSLNRQTEYGYDRFGRQTAIITGSDWTNYTYNYMSRVMDVNYPDGNTISFGYNMLGAVIRRTVTKNSQPVTTQYKRDALGRVSCKQYTDEVGWIEPNNRFPFDEILYDALGNKNLIFYTDGNDNPKMSSSSYDDLGNLIFIQELYGDFSSSISYDYDQMGLLTSIYYPSERTAVYTRDALGRVESVSFNGKTIVEYDYLGDTVISKRMSDVDIKYTAAIDGLGRITGETYSNISDSKGFLSNSYGYTGHSSRLDERNSVDYGFDTLGRVISEDANSYTCDILGNPTNTGEDNFSYTLDNEDRVIDVNDGNDIIAEYEYDWLGRRIKKTVESVETRFVYDIIGNVIAEYENGSWACDYVYGAKSEPVYMQIPQTTSMNAAMEKFISFVDSWLCNPYCSANDLQWDYDEDDQIDFIDYAAEVNSFTGAFTVNGRYLLTDFRKSVIGKVNLDGSVEEASYNAWGIPSYTGDLEGLAILWNGYYYDDETDNYYLRNRYYSPLERRFVSEDPRGINPDGNWNNPFNVLSQYNDGFGLRVYAQSDPVNKRDDWGLWYYAFPRHKRVEETRTFVVASGVWEMKYNIRGLAQFVRLNEEEFSKWGKRAIYNVNGVNKCGAWVPNRAYVDAGDISFFGVPNIFLQMEMENIFHYFYGEGYRPKIVKKNSIASLDQHLSDSDIIAWAFVGHGAGGALNLPEDSSYRAPHASSVLHHKLAQVILFACEAGKKEIWDDRIGYIGWKALISRYGSISISSKSFRSWSDWDDLPTE